jgi:hypothetical protein
MKPPTIFAQERTRRSVFRETWRQFTPFGIAMWILFLGMLGLGVILLG